MVLMVPAFARRDGAFKLNAMEAVAAQSEVRDEAEHWLGDVGLAGQKDTTAASLSRGEPWVVDRAVLRVTAPLSAGVSWIVAFPTLLVVLPVVRKLVGLIVRPIR